MIILVVHTLSAKGLLEWKKERKRALSPLFFDWLMPFVASSLLCLRVLLGEEIHLVGGREGKGVSCAVAAEEKEEEKMVSRWRKRDRGRGHFQTHKYSYSTYILVTARSFALGDVTMWYANHMILWQLLMIWSWVVLTHCLKGDKIVVWLHDITSFPHFPLIQSMPSMTH